MASKDIYNIENVTSKLSVMSLVALLNKYHIDPQFHPCLPKPGNAIVDAPAGFVEVYRLHFKSGLHLPTSDFLEADLDYYQLHIAQISSNGFRKEFFFVDASAFSRPIEYGVAANRGSDPPPDLSAEDHETIDRLAQNYGKWGDPKEVTLGMAGLSPLWNKLGKNSVETMDGREITRLYRLHKKHLEDSDGFLA
ncbi:unnamed protein product [Lactuca virosa]|uniref:Uncharacterized protein n=1 Tax=Lactuca virosa TaxID=75947 RepID=A0AAU9NSR6_9ASTR|nr:unnamed protein product [Lactuca virosa]